MYVRVYVCMCVYMCVYMCVCEHMRLTHPHMWSCWTLGSPWGCKRNAGTHHLLNQVLLQTVSWTEEKRKEGEKEKRERGGRERERGKRERERGGEEGERGNRGEEEGEVEREEQGKKGRKRGEGKRGQVVDEKMGEDQWGTVTRRWEKHGKYKCVHEYLGRQLWEICAHKTSYYIYLTSTAKVLSYWQADFISPLAKTPPLYVLHVTRNWRLFSCLFRLRHFIQSTGLLKFS